MKAKLLNKEKWPDFVQKLATKVILAPQGDVGRERFMPLPDGQAPDMEYKNTAVPPKGAAFPQTETLFRFALGKDDLEESKPSEEMILLGVRPCDARAFTIIDKLFQWDQDDPYYVRRRAQLTTIGLACPEPGLNCFCSSVNSGPFSTEGLDILLTDLGEEYLLDIITDKGQEIVSLTADLLAEAGNDDLKKRDELAAEAEKKIKRSVDHQGIPSGLPGLWESPIWKEVSAACLGCGTCTFLCPTCHCFDIQDETEGFAARRCRMWDSCMFAEYTLHTSGHNPRPTRRERTRNRINHKYSYYVDKFDVIACVGCGRCINLCPVNIDIINILRQVKEAL